jgi:hypothetical protein
MKTYLKIKIMSLAAETRIVRREEKRWPGASDVRNGLHRHRIVEVRREARSACLAYGFLRGRDYKALEARPGTKPDWTRVERLALKYAASDARETRQRFAAWKDTAEATM